MRHICLVTSACLLAGCAGPRPAIPDAARISAPPAWRDGARATEGLVDPAWWDQFGDVTLTRVVAQALERNDDIAIAAGRVEEARAQFRLARAQLLPNFALVGSGGAQRAPNAFGIDTDQHLGQATAQVSFDADLFGRLRAASAAARAAALSSEASRDNVRLAVAASAASGYLTLRALDARLQVLHDTLVARADSLKLAQRRSDVGYAPRLDLAQAEADYRSTKQLIPLAELAIRRQEDGLSVLMGDPPGPIDRGRLLADITLPSIGGSLPIVLIRRRPDILAAEQTLVAADHQLDSARAAFLPTVQLTAAGGAATSSLLPSPISLYNFAGSILAPILDTGRLRAQQGIQAARRDQAAFAYRRMVLEAYREVEDAMSEVSRYAQQESDLIAQREALATALRLATNRYRAGYSPYLEQLDAQRSLLSADLAVVQARSDRLTSAVRLFQALGGGWGVERN